MEISLSHFLVFLAKNKKCFGGLFGGFFLNLTLVVVSCLFLFAQLPPISDFRPMFSVKGHNLH